MKYRWSMLLVGLLALFVGACDLPRPTAGADVRTVQPTAGADVRAAQPTAGADVLMQEPTCTVGEPRPVAATEHRFDVLAVNESPASVEYIDGQRTGRDIFLPLYNAVKNGRVPRFEGSAEVTYTLIGVRTRLAPTRVPFLSGMAPTGGGHMDGICREMVRVTVDGNRVSVTVPMRGGEHLGQTSVIFPQNMFSGIPDPAVCVTFNRPIIAPRLTAGPMQGMENTYCGLPGALPGTTLLGDRIARHMVWSAIPTVVAKQ